MNINRSTYCLFALLAGIVFITDSGFSQTPYDELEYITMFSDRNMYAVGERIYFSSFYRKAGGSGNEFWSKVLYVELITPSGSVVTNGKFRHTEKGSSGYLLIPEDALTGNYYLRSYTRWMRNFGPRSYCYTPLTIINPHKPDIQSVGDESSGLEANLLRMDFPAVQCKTHKTSYAPGEEVQIEISSTASDKRFPMEYCLTVAHVGLCQTLNANIDIDLNERDSDFHLKYFPDLRGISISGSVIDPEDQSLVSEVPIHFSTLGEHGNYFCKLSDETGRFILTLPDMTGVQELFVVCESSADAIREIRIDQDYTSDAVPIRTRQFSLPLEAKRAATRMVLNMQLSKAYKLDQADPGPDSGTNSYVPFYGIPNTTVYLEEYVNLPTMNEVFVNLVPNVFVRYNQGDPYLRIESLNKNMFLFPPLFLIDNIPVFEQKAIFSIDPTKIKSIEVVNEAYVRGEIIYGGIINISSKKGDMAAIDLPEGSYFFDYQTFYPAESRAPTSGSNERIPDTRNTQLWIDKISLDSEEKKTLSFPASFYPGEYNILVRGVSPQGEIIYGVSTFKVEKK